MNNPNSDNIILTLDAGGTNFSFSAVQNAKVISDPIILPSEGDNLYKCIKNIITGFEQLQSQLTTPPRAISFAFPGPADYGKGIIGDLGNLSGFRGGVPLGPILEKHFKIPVFINNDGDLFTYGEAMSGCLPEINKHLEISGNSKRYHNLIGLTLGTGFGGGIVRNKEIFLGDNSMSAEVWLLSNRYFPQLNTEELLSIRGIQKLYQQYSSNNNINLLPKDIHDIALGKTSGDQKAAVKAFEMMGKVLGDVIANLITLLDGIVVIGGGISKAKELYMPSVIDEINSQFSNPNSKAQNRTVQRVYNYEDPDDRNNFLQDDISEITYEGIDEKLAYESVNKTAIVHSNLGTNKSVALGAYYYALSRLNHLK